jgi:hypothetical protein
MNRRQFLSKLGKICAGVPIVGSLCATGQSGGSECNPEDWKMEVAPYDDRGNSDNIEIISNQKFHAGDCVFIDDLPETMSHFPSDCYATVLYSYSEKYGKPNPINGYKYALNIDGKGHSSWYPERFLIPVKPKPLTANEIKQKDFESLRYQVVYQHYYLDTNESYLVDEHGNIISKRKYDYCPYGFYGEIRRKIESGEIKHIVFKRYRAM